MLLASLLACVGICQAQAGRPTGDLIVMVPLAEASGASGPMILDSAFGVSLISRSVVRASPEIGMYVVRPPAGTKWSSLRDQLKATGLYSSVEPDTYAMPSGLTNDPLLSNQWHLFQISQPRALDFYDSTTVPVIAILDAGVELEHPDLAGALVSGYHVPTGLAQSSGGAVEDISSSGHGTRCAGIAAAAGNNGIGVSGVVPNGKVMPIRVSDDPSGVTTRSQLLAGINWAANNGAKIASVSYTEVEFPDVESTSRIVRANLGVNVVWSAGNTNTNWTSFDHLNVTVVGGTDINDARWSFGGAGSGYGPGVDVFAPANLIYTTKKGSTYGLAPAGVSFAVPQVAGALAMIRAKNPLLTAEQAEYQMLRYSRDLGPVGNDAEWGHGRLNLGASLTKTGQKFVLTQITNVGTISDASYVQLSKIDDQGRVAGFIQRNLNPPTVAVWSPPYTGAPTLYSWSDPAYPGSASGTVAIEDFQIGFPVGAATKSTGQSRFFFAASGTATVAHNHTLSNSSAYSLDSTWVVGAARGLAGSAKGIRTSTSNLTAWSNPWQSSPPHISSNFVVFKNRAPGIIWIEDVSGATWLGAQNGSTYGSGVLTNEDLDKIHVSDASQFNDFALNALNGFGGISFSRFMDVNRSWLENFSSGERLYGVNDSRDLVGASTPTGNFSDSIARIYRGRGDGQFSAWVEGSHPSVIFREVRDINNSGAVVVNATYSTSRRAYVGIPSGSPQLAVNLGQLGASPTYVGSIPPAMQVTITDEFGVMVPGTTQVISYTGSTGRLDLTIPPTFNNSYRVYIRCEQSVIPGYDGPRYISQLYPPMSLPAVPRDSVYLPFSGSTVSGAAGPLMLMYAGDVDESGEIDAADIDLVVSQFGNVFGAPGWDPKTDVDGSGEIDATDIDRVIANFGLADDPAP